MRPVNLIPPEQRRGQRAPLRTGPLPYVLLACLALGLLAVSALVLTGKQIDDRESEKVSLEAREEAATARAQALAPFAEFAAVSEARRATVTSLAQSRFDWERVLQELALVIPEDIWLTGLSGSVSPEIGVGEAAAVSISAGETATPSLAIVGCGTGHEAVAAFLEALKDIDGVTRVGIGRSERPTEEAADPGSPGDTDCRTREFISSFEILATFDDVALASTTPEGTVPAVPAAPAAPATAVAEATPEQGKARDSAAAQTDKGKNAANLLPGVAR
jgi:Tfp pilus assembly protein PilN